MSRTYERKKTRERGLLCAIAFACYASALASLVALGYALSTLALSAAGQQLAHVYNSLGVVAR